jgi:hypothetical protein
MFSVRPTTKQVTAMAPTKERSSLLKVPIFKASLFKFNHPKFISGANPIKLGVP